MPAITIPTASLLRMTTGSNDPDNAQFIPCVAGVDVPVGPVVPSGAANSAGQAKVKKATEGVADEGVANYLGYNLEARSAGQACSVVKGVIVDGFANVEVGKPVYITDDWATDTVGLVQTAPDGVTQRIGVGITATKIRFD